MLHLTEELISISILRKVTILVALMWAADLSNLENSQQLQTGFCKSDHENLSLAVLKEFHQLLAQLGLCVVDL